MDYVRGWNGGGLQGFVMVEHPAGQHGFGAFLDPLVDQGGNFGPKVGRVVQTSELKTLQRGARGGLQVVERRRESRDGHG